MPDPVERATLALAIGDCLGAGVEGLSPAKIRRRHSDSDGQVRSFAFEPMVWTDESSDPAPGLNPDGVRSGFEPEDAIAYYKEQHAAYLLLKSNEPALFDYLATLVAKEYVLYSNPPGASDELAEEIVRMLVPR